MVTLTIDASQYVAGSYTAELLAVNGTKIAKRTISYAVIRNDDPTNTSMDFYPNPCTDVLNVLANRSGEGVIRIRNSVGTVVTELNFSFTDGIPVAIDVSRLAPGVYTLEATCFGSVISRTIVKHSY